MIFFSEKLMTKEEEIQDVQIENDQLKNALTAAEDLGETLKFENDDLQSRLNEESEMKENCNQQLIKAQETINQLRIDLMAMYQECDIVTH